MYTNTVHPPKQKSLSKTKFISRIMSKMLPPFNLHPFMALIALVFFQRKIFRLGTWHQPRSPSSPSTTICTLMHSHIESFISSIHTRYNYPTPCPLFFLQNVTLRTYIPRHGVNQKKLFNYYLSLTLTKKVTLTFSTCVNREKVRYYFLHLILHLCYHPFRLPVFIDHKVISVLTNTRGVDNPVFSCRASRWV